MTLLTQLGDRLPERHYLGLDIGDRERVAMVISLRDLATGEGGPPTAPRSKYLSAWVSSLGGVDLPVVASGQECSGEVVATWLLGSRAQDAGD